MATAFNPQNIYQGPDGRWYHDRVDVTDHPAWWQCAENHEWQATIGARTSPDDVGCPTCYAARALRR